MKILFCSFTYPPSIGGIETVSEILAGGFHEAGHEVCVITQTPSNGPEPTPFRVLRQPDAYELWKAVKWSDVVFHNNISLRFSWPLLFIRRPWVISHHIWFPQSGTGHLVGSLKQFVLRFAHNVAVSAAIERALSVRASIIPNPYDDGLFVSHPEITQTRDLVFLGRLVPTKGVSVLLNALAHLRSRGQEFTLTIIGGGPEEMSLKQQQRELNLHDLVEFAGFVQGSALVHLLCKHRVMVIPSLAEEPFGLVALEGIACGLVPIASCSGGLPDAIGTCGVIVKRGDPVALAAAIEALKEPKERDILLANASEHLSRHKRKSVALAYLDVLKEVCRRQ